MPIDIVMPGNEKELLERGKALGFDSVILLYKDVFKTDNPNTGILIDAKNKNQVITKIRKAGKMLTFVKAVDDRFNRFIIEKTDAAGLVDVEYIHSKDHLHFRRSGLDQVICRFAAERGKMIVTSLKSLRNHTNKPLILGRIKQNIKFCRKYKVNYVIVSFAADVLEMKGAHDVNSLIKSLTKK